MSSLRKASTTRMLGKVTKWVPSGRGGYGILEATNSAGPISVFMHISAIARRNLPEPKLEIGENVQFTLDTRGGEKVAMDVTRPDGSAFLGKSADPTFGERKGNGYNMKHHVRPFTKRYGNLSEDVDT